MTFLKAAPAVVCMALLGVSFTPIAKADDRDKKTTVTFGAPVEIPGVHLEGWGVLPAGTYVFKLVNSSSNRHIVQIFNKDETQIYATILAIANYRLRPTNKTVITFNEGLRGKPEALRAWFYPGANWGEEFVYPKAKAVELAQVTKLPVLAVVTEVKAEVAKPEELDVVEVLTKAPVMAVKPTGEVVEIAQVIQTDPLPVQVAASPTQTADRFLLAENKLPDTASSLPLIALCGLLALGGALTIRSITKRAL
jgi:hypothetical protein